MDVQIPDKLYFKIGEVAELTGIKPHVLRYWESEIGSIRPTKNRHQQRLYRQRDIELILRLKDLLYSQGYTIAGARKLLRRKPAEPVVTPAPVVSAPVAASPPTADDGQMALPLGSGVDRRLLEELRRDLARLRDSLLNAP
ncbi:MAG: MerR family transcriptional regulator [Deltaproteobacteria bacterium]|nr:MAG: MerR family transcriptional regulator [Deltaproteobacteria bacterium]